MACPALEGDGVLQHDAGCCSFCCSSANSNLLFCFLFFFCFVAAFPPAAVLLFISLWLDLLVFGGNFSVQLFPFGQERESLLAFGRLASRHPSPCHFRCHFGQSCCSAARFFIGPSFVFIFILIAILIPKLQTPDSRLRDSYSPVSTLYHIMISNGAKLI